MAASSGEGGRLLGAPPDEEGGDQEELAGIDARIARVQEEKRQALKDPGPSWTEWFYFEAAKWWLGVLLLILNIWLAGFWIEVGSIPALVGTVAVAVYAEFLLWRFLWYRSGDARGLSSGRFRRTWLQPVPFGRWTPEGFRARAGLSPATGRAPNRGDEFL